ncbi:hypothetical protein ROHU_003378 [Labeo rohita]|uniref:Uncharacterized protein n=1 Tax=Labeo rohita TaxID=84645 RepID=A0A498LR27_LABRO|nr:hypothetical protein ROHU_010779 [Labeo rohita]RXN35959.1 hypothetical protein ROHU_003378 [Labeo rohita]
MDTRMDRTLPRRLCCVLFVTERLRCVADVFGGGTRLRLVLRSETPRASRTTDHKPWNDRRPDQLKTPRTSLRGCEKGKSSAAHFSP